VQRVAELAAWAGLLAVLAALMTSQGEWCDHEMPNRLSRPGLAIEIARSPAAVQEILGEPLACPGTGPSKPGQVPCFQNRISLLRQQRWDYVFIVTYAVFLALVGWTQWRDRRVLRAAGLAAAGLALSAAVCDWFEDRTIEQLLSSTPTCLLMPRPWALWKWGLLAAALMANVPLFVRRGDVTGTGRYVGYLAGLLSLVTAGLTAFALRRGSDSDLGTAVSSLTLTFFLTWIAIAAYGWFPDGLLAGLDRLGSSRYLKWITTWPSDDYPLAGPAQSTLQTVQSKSPPDPTDPGKR